MEVKSANASLLNRATTGVENNGSDSESRQQMMKVNAEIAEEQAGQEEESVKISISAAGMRKSKSMEGEMMTESDIEDMTKQIEGLSSQVINGHFSMTDRLSFQLEIKQLSMELQRLNGDGISFSKADNVQLSQRIKDLTRTINEAAVYHRSAKAMFMVKNQPSAGKTTRTRLDIAI